jgi:hypothetical protein
MAGRLDYAYLSTPTGMLNIAEIVCWIFDYRKDRRWAMIRLIDYNLFDKKKMLGV